MSSSESESGSSPQRAASPDPPPSKKSKPSSSKKRKNELDEIEVDLNLPEPPSKKAKRALKKGKPLPPKKDSDDEGEGGKANGNEDDDNMTTAAAKKEKERSPFGVWIGNLRFTVTKDDLRRWLVDNSGGAITEALITRVHLPAAKQDRGARALADFENRGFAYVDFATYEATVAAIALSETEWYRRKLLIKDAKSYEGRPEVQKKNNKNKDDEEEGAAAKVAAAKPHSTSRKIFVGNMSFQTTEDDVRDLFSKCGEIEWVKVATFEDSGKCKGYGWVKFKEAEAADWAAKGFVKIKEVEETEEDFMDVDDQQETKEQEEDEEKKSEQEDDGDDDGDGDEKEKPKASKKQKPAQEKKVKTRKWWVNQLNGRRLKIEHAEDDQTRYKKRFKKDPQQQQQQQKGSRRDQPPSSSRHDNNNSNSKNKRRDGSQSAENRAPAEVNTFRTDINVARLTGAAVKPEGKKTTFD